MAVVGNLRLAASMPSSCFVAAPGLDVAEKITLATLLRASLYSSSSSAVGAVKSLRIV
eukprot:CAMPEP_0119347048 /NCGR_PEP_ID=MMETSP1333-20130426/108321_1 /TAXON_ID=418940 /ORGANISM="Scyphosphaera apsteinii, Strain RCC1455" /LENGTH=57 /DNA_ID=CAMNT_0007359575 /DNA_START=774 /DNA_END=947 /DNA_ORIENTATION=-